MARLDCRDEDPLKIGFGKYPVKCVNSTFCWIRLPSRAKTRICRRLVGTAPHRRRGSEAVMEKSGLVYAVLQTGRTTPVPGDGEIRHRDLLWRIKLSDLGNNSN